MAHLSGKLPYKMHVVNVLLVSHAYRTATVADETAADVRRTVAITVTDNARLNYEPIAIRTDTVATTRSSKWQ